MSNIHDVCDYIILKVKAEDSTSLTNLKLQKLLYYVQAWYLAFNGRELFPGKFQAWIHGPVNRDIYDRFKGEKSLYSEIDAEDVLNKSCVDAIHSEDQKHIDVILEFYAKFSGTQLEYMTHQEEPWLAARQGFAPMERCEKDIDSDLMKEYYKSRLSESNE